MLTVALFLTVKNMEVLVLHAVMVNLFSLLDETRITWELDP